MSANYGSLRGYKGKVSRSALRVEIIAIQTDPHLDPYSPTDHLRMYDNTQIYREMLEKAMNDIVFGHRVEVKVYLA